MEIKPKDLQQIAVEVAKSTTQLSEEGKKAHKAIMEELPNDKKVAPVGKLDLTPYPPRDTSEDIQAIFDEGEQ